MTFGDVIALFVTSTWTGLRPDIRAGAEHSDNSGPRATSVDDSDPRRSSAQKTLPAIAPVFLALVIVDDHDTASSIVTPSPFIAQAE